MKNSWFISDTHFSHKNIVLFTDNAGNRIRPFGTVEEMDEFLVSHWNSRVGPTDRVYHCGDVAMNCKALSIVGRLNGRKVLLRGNHDIFKLRDYTPYFEDVRSYKIYPNHGIIVSHVPVHPQQLENRFKVNVHGHLHHNVLPDKRYVNICVEHTKYAPISFDEILKEIASR